MDLESGAAKSRRQRLSHTMRTAGEIKLEQSSVTAPGAVGERHFPRRGSLLCRLELRRAVRCERFRPSLSKPGGSIHSVSGWEARLYSGTKFYCASEREDLFGIV
jgi:hypothetical protein